MFEEFWAIMKDHKADYTNTFRQLAKFSKHERMTAEDLEVLNNFGSLNITKDDMLKKTKAPYEDNEKVLRLLATNPIEIKFYDADPDKIRREIEDAKQ